MTSKIYGIPNCDTVRKARKWLIDNNIDAQFHDFRKEGLERKHIKQWLQTVKWEDLLNKRSASWRQIAQALRDNINEKMAIKIMLENPTLIKRPVFEGQGQVLLGFNDDLYQNLL